MLNNLSDFGAEMAPPIDHTIQMSYNRIVKSNDRSMVVLRAVESAGNPSEYSVVISKQDEHDFETAERCFSGLLREDHDLLGELVEHFGVSISSVLIWESISDEKLCAQVSLLALSGERVSFPTRLQEAILYAVLHNIPILVEKGLANTTEPQSEKHGRTFVAGRDYLESYRRAIKSGKLPTDYSVPELEWGFAQIDQTALLALRQLAIELECYEWAQVISDFLESDDLDIDQTD